MSTALTTAVQDRVARITLSRPEVRNAFNDQVIQELKAESGVEARITIRGGSQPGRVFTQVYPKGRLRVVQPPAHGACCPCRAL